MYPIHDKEYLKTCASIASLMSISIASAKKKVELQITKKGCKTIPEKRKVAAEVLDFLRDQKQLGVDAVDMFNELMESLGNDDNFLVED